jgi:two-component system, NtrC family, sensor kinase
MLLLVLEDELTLNESAQKRDRRARAEMEQYSKLDISAVSYRDFGIHYDRVCEVITKASRFQRAAILLRGVEQNFHLAGRAGMEAELTRALDAMGQRMTPDKVKEFARSSHIAVELGNTRLVNLRPLLQHGDDLERLGFLRAYTIPMRTGTELDGVLVLSDLKAPTESLVAEDLLPLELLVARLAAARENNRLLRRLVQSEKLAGLGQLAGGVAHELNNPLTVVMGYAELIEEGEADHATRQNAGVIRTESQRMKQTIESLARFWKSLPSELAPLSVKQMLMDIWQPRKLELEREGIELEITIAEDLPGIRANGEQMRQVFGQVLNNSVIALQTFPANHEKRIRIDAATVKDKVQVVISDTGPGFPNLNRVFDPFFTTKKPGEGPGLGLSLCYSIIREHGGEISAFNLQPHGAAVAIEMPADVAEKPVPLAGEVSVQ